MKVSILTRSLTRGGAQVQVVTLAGGLARRGHDVSVVVFYRDGALALQATAHGARVVELGKSGRWSFVLPMRRLVRHLKSSGADVVYSFLPMENLFGLLGARIAGLPIVWGVRGAGVARGQYGLASRFLYGSQFRLMRMPEAVICNSQAAAAEIPAERARALHVVPNGIDTEKYRPDAQARQEWRAQRGFTDAMTVIGIVARLDPMKDHRNFLDAAGRIAGRIPLARFVVAGGGPQPYQQELQEFARQIGIADRVVWLGEVSDTTSVYRGIDVLVSSSAYGEGFSNSIGEGMACGVAAVATDVGDSRVVVGAHGRTVVARDAHALADAVCAVISEDSPQARELRRQWVVGQFGVDAMVGRTEEILLKVVKSK